MSAIILETPSVIYKMLTSILDIPGEIRFMLPGILKMVPIIRENPVDIYDLQPAFVKC